ncbi:MAG: hypothetical protein A4E67_02222 [Syntrophaceae bacterium PtaB.Bin038]|nr:MAG: hypothetical protein A4E67_02222 [Syntrophaceae bacterium PtaB.Bin038]
MTFPSVPDDVKASPMRRMEWRTRFAWGGNLIRRRDQAGAIIPTVTARSEAVGQPVSVAVDGFRPHEDPLDSTYAGHWESTGIPLDRDANAAIYDDLSDWSGWSLGDYGGISGSAQALSGSWGELSGTGPAPGTVCGQVAREASGTHAKGKFFQVQLASARPTASAGAFLEHGIILSNTNTLDVTAEDDAVLVSLRHTDAGVFLRLAKIVSGVETEVSSVEIPDACYSQNLKLQIRDDELTVFESRQRYTVVSFYFKTDVSHLDASVYLKLFTRQDDAVAYSAFFRDPGAFTARQIRCGGEVGFRDEFAADDLALAWSGIDCTLARVSDGAGGYMLEATSDQAAPAGFWVRAAGSKATFGDFRMTARIDRLAGANVAWLYGRLTFASGNGYLVQFAAAQVKIIRVDGGGGTDLATEAVTVPEAFEARVEFEGSAIRVYVDGALAASTTDPNYTAGEAGAGGYGDNTAATIGIVSFDIAERGLQESAAMAYHGAGLQNGSFEEWDAADGVTGAVDTVASAWAGNAGMGSPTFEKSAAGYSGNAQQINLDAWHPSTTQQAELWQTGIRVNSRHIYRVSFRLLIHQNVGSRINPGLNGFAQIAVNLYGVGSAKARTISDDETDYLAHDVWHHLSFYFGTDDFSDPAFDTNGETELKILIQAGATGYAFPHPFYALIDDVTIEDLAEITSADLPDHALGWVALREDASSRLDAQDGYEAFVVMPTSVVYRGADAGWSLQGSEGHELFRSRAYADFFPGDRWEIAPEWIAIDQATGRALNHLVAYPLAGETLRWANVVAGDSWIGGAVLKTMPDGEADAAAKLDLEVEARAGRYVQVVLLDTGVDGDVCTAQEIELYFFSDESARILQQPGSGQDVTVTSKRDQGANSLPNAGTFSVRLRNDDDRFDPRNAASPIYGERQADGLGEIRSGVQARLGVVWKIQETIEEAAAYEDQCSSTSTWNTNGTSLNLFPIGAGGFLRVKITNTSHEIDQPIQGDIYTDPFIADFSVFPRLRMTVAAVEGLIQWRPAVRVYDWALLNYVDYPLDVYASESGDFEWDLATYPALPAGTVMAALVLQCQFVQGATIADQTEHWVDFDHISLLTPATAWKSYETEVMRGLIGNRAASMEPIGISCDTMGQSATIDGTDFTAALDEPAPYDELDVWESESADDVFAMICYLGNIPAQDIDVEATGLTLPVAALEQSSLREHLAQLVKVLGGSAWHTPDGKIVYRNVYSKRAIEQSEKADYDAGSKTDVSSDLVDGDLILDDLTYDSHLEGLVLPEDELDDPWTVDEADGTAQRFVQDSKYNVLIPLALNSAMVHSQKISLDPTAGFVIEYRVTVDQATAGRTPVLDVWGYTSAVAARDTAACAWRLRLFWAGGVLSVQAGGKLTLDRIHEPYTSTTFLVGPYRDFKVRLIGDGANLKVYINNDLAVTVPFCTPREIRWYPFEETVEDWELEDDFTGAAGTVLKAHAPGTNTTGGVWVDPNDRYKLGPGGSTLVANAADDGTTYFDLLKARYILRAGAYFNGINSRLAGLRFAYVDANTFMELRILATTVGSVLRLSPELWRKGGGIYDPVATLPEKDVSEGVHEIKLEARANNIFRLYIDTAFLWQGTITTGAPSGKVAPLIYAGSSSYFDYFDADRADDFVDDQDDPLESDADPAVLEPGVAFGPVPPQAANTRQYKSDGTVLRAGLSPDYKPGYQMDWLRIAAGVKTTNVLTGSWESDVLDLSAGITAFGIFEAEYVQAENPSVSLYPLAGSRFYMASSADGIVFGSWVEVFRGFPILDVAVERYVKVKWEASITDVFFTTSPQVYFQNPHVPILRSITIHYAIASTDLGEAEQFEDQVISCERSLGNPRANRVQAAVNQWVEQALTDYPTTTFWESSDVPVAVSMGTERTWTPSYDYPAKRDTGANLMHAHLTIDGSDYEVDEGVSGQVCGNAEVSFSSGQRQGTITVEAVLALVNVTAVAVDAVHFRQSSDLGRAEKVVAEDAVAQAAFGAVIEGELIDNAFAASQAIAESLADFTLGLDKKHQESLTAEVPLWPTLTLGQNCSVVLTKAGRKACTVALTEVTHSGIRTRIMGDVVPPED